MPKFQLPAMEDDLWHEVVKALLLQRNVVEEQAANPLRLLEEWAFHRVFCEKRKVNRAWLQRTAGWIVETEPWRGPVTAVDHWIDNLKAWDLISIDLDGTYEFAIDLLDEYFAARHLAARWAENDPNYRQWLPSDDKRWDDKKALTCPNPWCGVPMPPFRKWLRQTEQDTLLLMLGLLKEVEREERVLKEIHTSIHIVTAPARSLDLRLKALSRCRHIHGFFAQTVAEQILLIIGGNGQGYLEGRLAIVNARRLENLDLILNKCLQALQVDNLQLQSAAATVLGWIGDSRAVDPLTRVLKDQSSQIRITAARALGKIGDERAAGALITVATNDRIDVVSAANLALARLNPEKWITRLLSSFATDQVELPGIASEAHSVLKDMGDAAIGPLVAILRDNNNNNFQKLAAYALQELGVMRCPRSRAVDRSTVC